jgi:Ca-activated chloride channel homolog
VSAKIRQLPMRSRARLIEAALWIVVAGIGAITVLVLVGWLRAPPRSPIKVTFVYTIDATDLLARPIDDFNRADVRVNGRRIVVTGVAIPSGQAEREIAAGRLRPVVWMPASSLWTRLLNGHQQALWAPSSPSFMRSPQVVAMWEPLARRLGWPRRSVRWIDLLRLARTDPGYRYGHTNPDFSTSGITALIAEYAAAAGHTAGGLTAEAVDAPGVSAAVRLQEDRIVHYGDTANAFLDQMGRYRQRYASWVVTQEASLVRFSEANPGMRPRLVAVYPSDGTYVADYPLSVLTTDTPWVDSLRHDAGTAFRTWLLGHLTAAEAANEGFRLGPPNQPARPPIDAAHGANPDPPAVLPLPSARVVAQIQTAWGRVRRPADVGLVVDGRCLLAGGEPAVEAGVSTLLNGFSPRDRVGLWTAAGQASERVRPARLPTVDSELRRQVAAMQPSATSAVFDAVSAARRTIATLPGADRLRGVIVLSDGRSDDSSTSLDELTRELGRSGGPDRVRVFVAACTPNPDMQVLRSYAYAAQGDAFEYDAGDIGQVYRSLSSYY